MKFNKHGMSVGYAWIFGLTMLFGLGILYVIFSTVFTANILPIMQGQLLNSYEMSNGAMTNETVTTVLRGYDNILAMEKIVPFVLFLCVIVFMIVAAWRRDTDTEQF